MPSILITGANRGIGLELARQYAGDGWVVHGGARRPEDAQALRDLGATVHQLDVLLAACSIRVMVKALVESKCHAD